MSVDIAKLRALLDAASPRPWRNGSDPSHFDCPEITDDKTFAYYVAKNEDAALIAAAVNALPELLAVYEALGVLFDAATARRSQQEERNAVQFAKYCDARLAARKEQP